MNTIRVSSAVVHCTVDALLRELEDAHEVVRSPSTANRASQFPHRRELADTVPALVTSIRGTSSIVLGVVVVVVEVVAEVVVVVHASGGVAVVGGAIVVVNNAEVVEESSIPGVIDDVGPVEPTVEMVSLEPRPSQYAPPSREIRTNAPATQYQLRRPVPTADAGCAGYSTAGVGWDGGAFDGAGPVLEAKGGEVDGGGPADGGELDGGRDEGGGLDGVEVEGGGPPGGGADGGPDGGRSDDGRAEGGGPVGGSSEPVGPVGGGPAGTSLISAVHFQDS
jgi:hypothetical protein